MTKLRLEEQVAESGSSQLLAKSSSTTGGIQKVEQTAPLRDGPALWAWDFYIFSNSGKVGEFRLEDLFEKSDMKRQNFEKRW